MRSLYSSETDIQSLKDADGQRSPPYACRYSHSCVSDGLYFDSGPRGKLLAVVGEAGCVSIFNTSNTLGRPTSTWFAHDNAIFDCAWSHDNKQLITASGDAYIRLWDIETQKCVMGFRGHRGSVKSVSWCPTQPDVISTASRDGRIMSSVIVIPYAHLRPAQLNMMLQSATKLKLHTPRLVKFWDLRAAGTSKNWRNAVRDVYASKTRKRSFGLFSSLSLNNAGTKLYASCLDNSIHEFNTHALGAPVRQLSYPSYQCNSFYIRTSISPDDSTLMSGSMDGGVYLWDIQNPTPRPPLILKGHTSETSGVAWCNADIGQASDIATCSDDMTVRVWRAGLALASLPDDPGSVHLRGLLTKQNPLSPRKTVTPKSRSGSQTPRSLPLLSDSTRLNLRSSGQSTEEGNTDKKSTRNGMSILNYFHAIPAVSTGSSSALLIPADVPANTTSS
ncbi:hypothetical protein BSLG_002686 [Batrachochytrium salamandrivorans]|nr:hypothetical protein BSLG_002686 [Batrachochytrium salamandrivorans]